jgi:sugar phosphate isomerase/epimerase
VPGYGDTDFQKVVETLKEINYQGYVLAEILTTPD